MGAKPSVQMTADTDSVLEPGTKVVMSEGLEVDFDLLMDEYLEQHRYPIDSMKEYVLKSCDIEEHGKDDFTVKVILDGKKLDSYGYGRGDGIDRIDLWTRVTADRTKRELWSRPIVPPPGAWADEVDQVTAGGGACSRFTTEEPMRCEFHIVLPDGSAYEQAIDVVQPILGAAIMEVSKKKVKVKSDQDSIKASGEKSVVSEPMDEFTTYDEFWDKFIEVLKAGDAAVSPELVEVSDSEFHTVVTDTITDPTTEQKWITKIRHSKESGEIQIVTMNNSGILSKAVIILHKDPLRVESWGEDKDGVRQFGRGSAKGLQRYIDAVLEPKSSGWFW